MRIGISGWTYAPWRGIFYPRGLSQKRELEHASRRLNSIEINGSFYSLQRPTTYQAWHDATPDDFLFSLKGPRFITHMRRLKDAEAPLANFFASGVLALKEKLGPILWQLPPNFSFDAGRLENFFRLLPRDTQAAAKLAAHHDDRLKGRALTIADARRPLRYALEIRHESFASADFIDLLRRHNVALVFADTAGKWPYIEDVTADFIYARLHGDEELYASGYSASALDSWAVKFQAWQKGGEPSNAKRCNTKKPPKMKTRDLFVYFDNDVKVKAPFDAMALADRMGEGARGVGRTNQPQIAPATIKKLLNERVRLHWPGVGRTR
jgi:uncharacterized protein YecE (DUF72 family)